MKKKYRLTPLSIIWLTLLCLVVVGFSFLFNLNSLERASMQMVQIKGQTVFHLIQTTRHWNARHGGVYVPITEETPANPLLKVEERDIVTPNGIPLTMVNPAYMTRQLGELLKGSDVEIHLTSLNPLNKSNEADPWETRALKSFEQGISVQAGLEGDHYRYMEPLITEKVCLDCHREQGYREGDIRGGLSLKFPRSDIDALVHALKEDVKKAHVGLFFSLWVLGYLVNIGFVRLKGSLRVAADKEAKLNNLAMTDELTGILNRRSLMEAYEQSMNLAERKGWPLSVLMLDIDHFKQVNDQHGHQMGDEVLVRFARSVSATLRESDLMGRYGGEEFLIIMQDEDVNGAFAAAERIRKIVQSMSFQGATPFTVQVSIGVAERTQFGDTSPEELLKAADVALYRAKNTGRNRTCMAEAG